MTFLLSSHHASLLFIFLEVLRTSYGQCPQNFTSILDSCIHIAPRSYSYCKAQAYCHSLHGEIFFGNTFMKFNGKVLSQLPTRYWVGLTDLKNERNISREGWIWTDGSSSPSSKLVTWNWSRPKTATFDCTYILKLETATMYETGCGAGAVTPICQPRSVTAPHASFEAETIPAGLSGSQLADGPCTKVQPAVTVIECAALCFAEQTGWCAAIYFHGKRRQCIFVLYTDATLSLSPDDGGWKKFVLRPL